MTINEKKILLIVGSLNQGGAEFQLLSLARLLQDKGHCVEVLAITDYSYYLPFIKENHINYSFVTNNGKDLQRIFRAIRQINARKPDLAISYIKKVSQVAILARIFSGFRFKLIISERTSLIKPWHDFFYFNLALLANRVIVNSISKYDYIRGKFPLLRSRTVFFPNIIDIGKFSIIQRSEPSDNRMRISYVGRISPEKNLINLVKAMRIIADKGYKFSFSMIGEANNLSYLSELKRLVHDQRLDDIVQYLGATGDIKGVYENTDLLCLVSIFEGFSNVLSEALACGIPVVASNIPENRYLLRESENGFLVEANEPESIAEGIEKYLRLSESDRQVIGENNRKRAIELFDPRVINQKYIDLFNGF